MLHKDLKRTTSQHLKEAGGSVMAGSRKVYYLTTAYHVVGISC